MNISAFKHTLGLVAGVTLSLLACVYSHAEVVKWVDENGKVHYGDRVPDKYREKAEKIEMDNVSVVGQEADTKSANKQYSQELKRQDAKERRMKEREARKAQKAHSKNRSKSTLTREQCRNLYPQNVKKRTNCFLKVENNKQSNY